MHICVFELSFEMIIYRSRFYDAFYTQLIVDELLVNVLFVKYILIKNILYYNIYIHICNITFFVGARCSSMVTAIGLRIDPSWFLVPASAPRLV